MPHISELEMSRFDKFVDSMTRADPTETLIYINIGGAYDSELEQALNAIYFDNTRKFELVEIKRSKGLIGVLVGMKQITPQKF